MSKPVTVLSQKRFPKVVRRFGRLKYVILGFIVIGLLAPWLADDVPLYCQRKDQENSEWPLLYKRAEAWGLVPYRAEIMQTDWHDENYKLVIWPLVPYSPHRTSIRTKLLSPGSAHPGRGLRFLHWLGTDSLGRDVLAGLIAGTRTAMVVGFVAVGLAVLLGLLFGAISGFFGDRGLRPRLGMIIALSVGVFLAGFYAWLTYLWGKSNELIASVFLGIILLAWLIGLGLSRLPLGRRTVRIPADAMVLRLIELTSSLPALLLLLVVASVLQKPSLLILMLLIGALSWTTTARFVRAELVKIRVLPYIEAARALGLNEWQILWRHALPNALGPVFVTAAFGFAGAVLLEAALSFLGIGLPLNTVTWGRLLYEANQYPAAWWLALFPGGAIFLTIWLFNVLGERAERV